MTTQDMPDPAATGLLVPGFGADLGALERPELERALTDLQARYRGLIDHLPAVIYLYRFGDGTMVEVSPGIRQLLGIEPEAWLDDPEGWYASIHPDDLARVVDESGRCIEAGVPFRLQYRAVRADGETIWIKEETAIVPDQHGAPAYWLGLMLDVSEFVRTRQQLHEAQRKYGALVEQIPAIVYVDVADEDMSTSYVSPQIDDAARASRPRSTWPTPTCGPSTCIPRTASTALATYLKRPRRPASRSRSSTACSRATGTSSGSSDSAIVVRDADGRPQYVQGVMLDITDRKAAEEQLAFLAYHDKLTGLPNRAMFEELLDLAIARARRTDLGGGRAVHSTSTTSSS